MFKGQENARRYMGSLLLACLTVFALGLDMSVEMPAKLIQTLRAGDFWGQINNLLIALNEFHTMDHLTGLVLAIACIWLYQRYLLGHRACAGEYILSGFLALTMLVSEAAAKEDTITCLWSGGTQCLKAALYLAGLWPLFLALLRLMREGLARMETLGPLPGGGSLWARHPFAMPFAVMALCWTPFLMMKYPGGMSPDATVQILDYVNGAVTASHPPFTTAVYGAFYNLGIWLGNSNWGIFLITLAQTVCFLCVLAYACVRMRSWGVNRWVYAAVLGAFCVSPNYSGWATCLVKDVPYAIACVLLCVLLADLSIMGKEFWRRKSSMPLLAVAFVHCWLWRRNGPAMALGCALAMLFAVQRGDRAALRRLLCTVGASVVFCVGVNAALCAAMEVGPAAKREVYSPLLQMTGKVVSQHGEELPDEEIEIIGKVMDYEKIASKYDPIITDGVKSIFNEDASEAEYRAYRALALEHLKRYPLEYLDAYLNVTYRLFDIRSDRGNHIQRREISHPYYIRSYTNLLYQQEELESLNAAQEAVENYNFWFPDLPLAGLMANVGFCTDALLMLGYLTLKQKRKRLIALVPAALTVLFCLASPLGYIRYALPMAATLPIGVAAYAACEGYALKSEDKG